MHSSSIISSPSADVASAAASLEALEGKVNSETWEFLRMVCGQLRSCSGQMKRLEMVAEIPAMPLRAYRSCVVRENPRSSTPQHFSEGDFDYD